jgi:hypothetical protein
MQFVVIPSEQTTAVTDGILAPSRSVAWFFCSG